MVNSGVPLGPSPRYSRQNFHYAGPMMDSNFVAGGDWQSASLPYGNWKMAVKAAEVPMTMYPATDDNKGLHGALEKWGRPGPETPELDLRLPATLMGASSAAEHLQGTCRPCRFNLFGGCRRSFNCKFCHLDHGTVTVLKHESKISPELSRWTKQAVTKQVAELHGAYQGLQTHGHALYLDCCELLATQTLLKVGWPPEVLHVPKSSAREYAFLMEQLDRFPIKIYHQTSTGFLKDAVDLPWVQEYQATHNARGPFSLVYLGYTSTKQRLLNLNLLFRHGLLTRGVLAITCRRRFPEMLRNEAEALLCGAGQQHVEIDDENDTGNEDAEGLAQLDMELRSLTHSRIDWFLAEKRYTFTCLRALSYSTGKTKSWVAIYRVAVEPRNSVPPPQPSHLAPRSPHSEQHAHFQGQIGHAKALMEKDQQFFMHPCSFDVIHL